MPVAIELSPEEQAQFRKAQWPKAAVKGGLLAGAIVWLFPSGNPWTSFARPSGAHIMGRTVNSDPSVTFLSPAAVPAHLGHFALSILFGFIITFIVYRLRSWKAILAGGLSGLALYGLNYLFFHNFAARLTGEFELNVAMAHLLFGLVASGVIRGFLRPPQKLDRSQPNPGPRYP